MSKLTDPVIGLAAAFFGHMRDMAPKYTGPHANLRYGNELAQRRIDFIKSSAPEIGHRRLLFTDAHRYRAFRAMWLDREGVYATSQEMCRADTAEQFDKALDEARAADGVGEVHAPLDPAPAMHACATIEKYLRDRENEPYPGGALPVLREFIKRACGVPAVQAPMPFDEAAVFTIWQGMQFQGGITNQKSAMLFARQVLAAHGIGEVPTYGVKGGYVESFCTKDADGS